MTGPNETAGQALGRAAPTSRPFGEPRVAPASPRPTLSVVAPAFNQEATIHGNILRILERLDTLSVPVELIVVSDGSGDDTYAQALRAAGDRVRVLEYGRNLGKGYALRTGSRVARGDWVAWVDSDLDLDPALLSGFLDMARKDDLDIVVGSKRHPRSVVDYPRRRRVYSWLYQQLVRALFRLDVRDTQVGMKLFRRQVLESVLPVVLVKRYAFDLEMLAVARRFGFRRIDEAPIRLDYQFSGSGVNWRAILHALWDTAAVFYRLRLRRFYDARRRLTDRTAAYAAAPLPSCALVRAAETVDEPTAAEVRRLLRRLPSEVEVLLAVASAEGTSASRRAQTVALPGLPPDRRLAAAAMTSDADVVAFLGAHAEPGSGWAESALGILRDPAVAAVVGPVAARFCGDLRRDVPGILLESRLGVGGARIRHHVGRLTEVDDFPATNLFVRTEVLRRVLRDGDGLDDTFCARVAAVSGGSVVCSPDVVVTARPEPLRPHLRALLALGRERGLRLRRGGRIRARHIVPPAFLLALAATPVALLRGGVWADAAIGLVAAYALLLGGFAGAMLVLHRRPRLALAAAGGVVASHVAFGAGVLAGVLQPPRGRAGGVSASP